MFKQIFETSDGQCWLVKNSEGRISVAPILPDQPEGQEGQGQEGESQADQLRQQGTSVQKVEGGISDAIKQAMQAEAQQGNGDGNGDGDPTDGESGREAGTNSGDLSPNPDQLEAELKRVDQYFKQRLTSVMTDNKYDRHLRGRTKGKLDMKALWRSQTGAKNLFTQKQTRKNKEYNIVLLIDQSGSMQEVQSQEAYDRFHEIRQNTQELYYKQKISDDEYTDKLEGLDDQLRQWHSNMALASRLAVFLANHFQDLNLNLGIIGFDDQTRIYKPLDDGKVEATKLFKSINISGGGTNILKGIAQAYKMVGTRPNSFIIVMTDGDINRWEGKSIRQLEQANRDRVKLSGYGIHADIKHAIDTSWRVDSVDQIKRLLVNYLGRNIRRGI